MPKMKNGYLVLNGTVWWVSEDAIAEESSHVDCGSMVFYPMLVTENQKTICPKLNENNTYVG